MDREWRRLIYIIAWLIRHFSSFDGSADSPAGSRAIKHRDARHGLPGRGIYSPTPKRQIHEDIPKSAEQGIAHGRAMAGDFVGNDL